MKKAILTFLFITVLSFTFSYFFYPFNLLPMPVGWDTPKYIWRIRAIADDSNFITKIDFNNFIYIILGSLFVKLGVRPFIVEILLPPVLLLTLFIEVYFLLTKLQPNKNWKIYTFITLSWFAIYRVASDLHKNLLALNLLLPSVYFFYVYLKKNEKRYIGIAIFLLTLSSFTHVESTLFLTFILVLSLLIEKSLGKVQKMTLAFLLLITSLPATLLYYVHIKKLLIYSGGSFGGSTMALWQWLVYLGPTGFIGIYELIKEIRFRRDRGDFLRKLFAIWGFVSILVGLIQYLEPTFTIYSDRAVMLFPVPFLAIHKFKELDYNITPKKKILRTRLKINLPILLALINVFIVFFGPFYNISISPQTYEKMLFLREKFYGRPILIIADYSDNYAGALGAHTNDWGNAVIGNVFTYTGNIYYLRDFMPTPFFYWSSKQISNLQFQEIYSNLQSLDDAVIIYGLDFTDLTVLPKNFEEFMEPLRDDLYVVNLTKLQETSGKFVIPVFQYSRVKYGTWYLSNKNWSDYHFVFECRTENAAQPPAIEVLFAVKKSGTYRVDLRYLANETTYLEAQVDQSQILKFNGTAKPENVTVYTGPLMEGEHFLKITVYGIDLHAYLDVLEVHKLPSLSN